MASQPKIKTSLSVQRKLSLAAGIFSAIATFISLIKGSWGFDGVGDQLITLFMAANTVINTYFFGATSQKIAKEKENESDN